MNVFLKEAILWSRLCSYGTTLSSSLTPLTSGETLFILHLMEFKWDSDAPFPAYKTLAARMGISDKMARRHAKSLQDKGYLKRRMRVGQTNRFDLNPLFDTVLKAVQRDKKKRRIERKGGNE